MRRFRLRKEGDNEELHRVRIKVKRARYAAELVPTDAVVAEAYVSRAAEQSSAIRPVRDRLVEHQRARRERARQAFDETWPRLARRGRKAWRVAPDADSDG